jgi:hypothetical protein
MFQKSERLPGWQTQPTQALSSAITDRARAMQRFNQIGGKAQATHARVANFMQAHATFELRGPP